MQKTKLGISVGFLGAAIYFTGLFSGFYVAVLLAGYVLLFEENEWLRRSVVKTIALMIFFPFLIMVIGLITDIIGFIDDIVAIFGGDFYVAIISQITTVMISAINIMETVVFLVLGIKALNQGTISIPVIDKLISKYMG